MIGACFHSVTISNQMVISLRFLLMQFPQNKMVYLCKDPNKSYEIYSQAMLPYERGALYYCHHDMFSNISLEIFRTNILGTNSLSANWSAKTIPSLSKQILINNCQLNPVWNWLIFTDSLLFGRYRSARFASVFLSSLFLIRSDPTSFIQLAIKYSTRFSRINNRALSTRSTPIIS